MRRKVKAVTRPAVELLTFDAGQVFMASTPDVERWAPSDAPRDGWRATRAWQAWKAARAAWVAGGGEWPGGEDQREQEETARWPDEPFEG